MWRQGKYTYEIKSFSGEMMHVAVVSSGESQARNDVNNIISTMAVSWNNSTLKLVSFEDAPYGVAQSTFSNPSANYTGSSAEQWLQKIEADLATIMSHLGEMNNRGKQVKF